MIPKTLLRKTMLLLAFVRENVLSGYHSHSIVAGGFELIS